MPNACFNCCTARFVRQKIHNNNNNSNNNNNAYNNNNNYNNNPLSTLITKNIYKYYDKILLKKSKNALKCLIKI